MSIFKTHKPFLIYSFSGSSARQTRPMAEIQNVSNVCPNSADHTGSQEDDSEISNSRTRRRLVVKRVMTRSGEFVVRYNRNKTSYICINLIEFFFSYVVISNIRINKHDRKYTERKLLYNDEFITLNFKTEQSYVI